MFADFMNRAPPLHEPQPLQAFRPDQYDHWPMVTTAIVSIFILFLLGSFILFACHRLSDTTAEALCPEAVEALPVIRAGSALRFHCCAVCLAEYQEREMVKQMPVCGHLFHPECIDAWLLSHGSCPVCRCSDLLGSRAGEVRVDVFESERERGEEEEHRTDSHGKILRSRSCSSKVGVKGIGAAMVFLKRSCSV